jgi:molecular chaperone DnaK (HSP70)
MARMREYGIDFGTTNSVLATYDLYNDACFASAPIPSVVWFNGSEVIVGKKAKSSINSNVNLPGNTFVSSVKSRLGQNLDIPVLGESIPPYIIASKIFKHLIDSSDEPVDAAVITVPVKFNGNQRADIRKAANEVGIYVKNFIHEPFAGVIGYLKGTINQGALNNINGKHVIVFDWGGGTLDITVVKVENDKIYEVGTGGIPNKAGDYFDKMIETLLTEKFAEKNNLNPLTVNVDPRKKDELIVRSEEQKIELSNIDTELGKVMIQNFYNDGDQNFNLIENITTAEFESMIKHTVDESIREIELTLNQAGISSEQIALALLIGGSSKIPFVVRKIERLFGSRTHEVTNSDTIIAEGAAIISRHNWKPYLANPIYIKMSDNSYYKVFAEGELLIPGQTSKEVALFVTDKRSGEANLILAEQRNGNEMISLDVLNIPIESDLSKKMVERVTVQLSVNEDLVIKVKAFGQVKNIPVQLDLVDIRYGLRID